MNKKNLLDSLDFVEGGLEFLIDSPKLFRDFIMHKYLGEKVEHLECKGDACPNVKRCGRHAAQDSMKGAQEDEDLSKEDARKMVEELGTFITALELSRDLVANDKIRHIAATHMNAIVELRKERSQRAEESGENTDEDETKRKLADAITMLLAGSGRPIAQA